MDLFMVDCALKENSNSTQCQVHVKKCNNHHVPTNLRPLIPYFGGKSRVANEIVCRMPEHTSYTELFVGGGSVYWKNDIAKNFIINDLNKDIYQLYKESKSNPKSVRKCDISNFNKDKFNKLRDKKDKNACEVVKLYKHAFSGTPKNGYADKGGRNFKNPLSEQHLEKIQKTRITNKDFREIMKERDVEGELMYADPPYVKAGGAYFTNGVTPKEVCDSARKLKKAKVMISYDDDKEVRANCIGRGLKVSTLIVPYSASNGPRQIKKELLITNY